jgi:c-di-GMP-binding flagellar brake protein YcgR
MSQDNRRHDGRIRIDPVVRVPVHVRPVIPFIGQPVEAGPMDISQGGMAVRLRREHCRDLIPGSKIKVHFRLPGMPLQECKALVRHNLAISESQSVLGILFLDLPVAIAKEINQMVMDDEACEQRATATKSPWCDPTCAFHYLCRKSFRFTALMGPSVDPLEIALQTAD